MGNVWQMVLKESALISVTGLVDLMRQTEVAAGSTRLPFLFYAAAAGALSADDHGDGRWCSAPPSAATRRGCRGLA